MGKLPYLYTDSDDTEDTSSSVESLKKKKRFSILKYTSGNLKKKKCKIHTKSEPSESDFWSRSPSSQKMTKRKLVGILKHTERESSEDEADSELQRMFRSQDRCLVGQVPRPPGTKPGRGGGFAIVVRKNVSNLPTQQCSTSSTKKRKSTKRLSRKCSY